MPLSRKQFDILEALTTSKDSLAQRALESITGHSLGEINKTLKELSELSFVSDGSIMSSELCVWLL